MLIFACALAASIWSGAPQAGALPARQLLAITEVTVIDVQRERSIGPRTVLVDAGRIIAIDAPREADIPANAQRIDGRGRFLIPGLVDMHVHLFNNASRRPPNDWAFPLFIANGVVGVREMAAEPAQIVTVNRWRKEVNDGVLVAPRVLAAGVPIHGGSPEDASSQVDAAADAGADFIKIFSDIPVSHWRAILTAALPRSLPVVGHAPSRVSLAAAAAAGQKNSEHLMQAFEVCSRIEAEVLAQRHALEGDALSARVDAQELNVLQAFDRRACRQASQSLAAAGQVHGPTLVIQRIKTGDSPSKDPRWRLLRADEQARWERILAGPVAQDQAREQLRLDVARRIVSAMHRAGVSIVAGTDSPMPNVYPGFSLHEELALLVESGLSPHEALRAATLTPAEFLGIAAEGGSVVVGKRADLVLLDADPIKDIHNTRRINAVVFDGRLLQRADLDELLEPLLPAR